MRGRQKQYHQLNQRIHLYMKAVISTVLVIAVLQGIALTSKADVVVSAGYLNNLSGAPNPADVPDPFDPSPSTILIASGGVNAPHDTGVLLFQNQCPIPVTIDQGISVTTQGAVFQIWDGSLPIVLAPGQNLVLAETANFNFDPSDFGLGINPVVAGSVDGNAFSFTDTGRILLGHEEAGNTAETTPYGVIGRIECVPDSPVNAAFVLVTVVAAHLGLRRRG